MSAFMHVLNSSLHIHVFCYLYIMLAIIAELNMFPNSHACIHARHVLCATHMPSYNTISEWSHEMRAEEDHPPSPYRVRGDTVWTDIFWLSWTLLVIGSYLFKGDPVRSASTLCLQPSLESHTPPQINFMLPGPTPQLPIARSKGAQGYKQTVWETTATLIAKETESTPQTHTDNGNQCS